MDITQDPSINAVVFTQKAKEFFVNNKTPEFTSTVEAGAMISAADPLVDIYVQKLTAEGVTYSDQLILEFGSALGEAYKMLFLGEWNFSPSQERWVILFTSPKGSLYEVNIFNKLRKRFDNGMEDSIQYYFDMLKKMYLEEADSFGFKD